MSLDVGPNPDIAELLDNELRRQRDTLEMIASENFAPRSVLQLQGSVLTNKYAEGLPALYPHFVIVASA